MLLRNTITALLPVILSSGFVIIGRALLMEQLSNEGTLMIARGKE